MSWTITTAGRALRDGTLTCVGLLDECLAHADRVEASVRAWVLIDRERARAEAAARDQELKGGNDRGPLHGMPVGIKDIFDVFDWPTACGSRLWKDAVARQDATVVRRLRQAGAVLVGKTVTTQYASFDPPPTRNPWDLSRTPGGSSSGSAAAVATRTCLAAIGSQTGGSITRPASYCGVPACKPSYGVACLDGVLPLAPSMDHPGPMATCVYDVALVMQVIADPGLGDLVSPLRRESRPPVLGRLRGLFDDRTDAAVRASTDAACQRLAAAGATVRDVALPAAFAEILARHRIVMAVESAAYHAERLRRQPDDYGPCIRELLAEGLACPASEYVRTLEHQRELKAAMAGVFGDVEALVCPATTTPAPAAATTGDPAFNSPWSYTGLPVVSLPTGLVGGLPVGIQLVGPARGEAGLFAAAAWAERALAVTLGEPPAGGR